MKKIILFATFFIITVSLNPLRGQGGLDTLRYSQESGTLQKQRFIDQYDYVFMTKEPTKWMLRFYTTGFQNPSNYSFISGRNRTLIPYEVAFERKITPSFSIAVGGAPHLSVAYAPLPLNSGGFYVRDGGVTSVRGFAELKWYYNLAKRIRENKSANNFSGNYLSIRAEKSFADHKKSLFNGYTLIGENGKYLTEYTYEYYQQKIGLAYGIQRRFFRNGFIDFSVNLDRITNINANQKLIFKNGDNSIPPSYTSPSNVESVNNTFSTKHTWQVQTEMRFGLAIGDFRKRSNQPLCDVLQCHEEEKRRWKIGWPSLRLGAQNQMLASSIAYERKIGNSSFSVNTQIDGYFENQQPNDFLFNSFQSSELLGSLQSRYYFTQKRRILKRGGGSNLSGVYSAASLFLVRQQTLTNNERLYSNRLEWGPTLGFQQKLFKHGYIDFNFSFTKVFSQDSNFKQLVVGDLTFRPSFKLGFAF